jgi:hypothetical protein
MEVDLDKLPFGTSDPDKLGKMKSVFFYAYFFEQFNHVCVSNKCMGL